MEEKLKAFPLPLILKAGDYEKGKRLWILEAPFICVSSFGVITIPEGFETDLASIPKFLHNLCGPADELLYASIPHDYLYETGKGTKEQADKVFLEALFNLGVPWYKRNLAFIAVKYFGRGNFRKSV